MLPQYANDAYPQAIRYTLAALLNILIGIALLFFLTPIGIVCIVAGSLHILATRKETARRYIVQDFFRVPQYPRFSAYLLRHPEASQIVNVGAVAVIVLACYLSVELGYKFYICIAIFSLSTAGILNAAVKMLIKFHVDTYFRIVMLRRNSGQWAMPHKSVIMPACGAYGQVLLLTDKTLRDIWEGGSMRMNQWVLAEVYYPVVATGANWQQVIHLELLYADFVIFDWSGTVTENMIWECESALSLVPVTRMMMIYSQDSEADIVAVFDRIRPGLSKEIYMTYRPDAKMTLWTAMFQFEFRQKMESLKAGPRPWSDPGK